MGCDMIILNLYQKYLVSIHAPAWGATSLLYNFSLVHFVSIHAPAWGATYQLSK